MKNKLIISIVLIVIGCGLFFVELGKPTLECATEQRTSGMVAVVDGKECPISIESYDEYEDYISKPKPLALPGAALVLAGVVYLGYTLVSGKKAQKSA